MPLVRMLTSVAGRNFDCALGDVVEMSPQLARIWADGVRGELVSDEGASSPERGHAPMETRRRPGRPRKIVD